MPDAALTVTIARELEALIPAYLANRARELEALRSACAAGDFASLQRIGHRMQGAGASYGFARISAYGEQIQGDARSADAAAAKARIEAYADYLARLRVTYA